MPESAVRAAPTSAAREGGLHRARTEPLGAERYAVQFTASGEVFAQLQELRALMRHQIPDGEVGKILARAIGDLLAQVRRRKFGECSKPQPARPTKQQPSRHIPAAIRRAVAQRDSGRCTFLSASGRRCDAREFLEFDHAETWQRTRTHSVEGIRLRCRAHNQHAADQEFGERHMNRFRKRAEPGAGGATEIAPAREPARPRKLDPNPVAPAWAPAATGQLDSNPVEPDQTPATSGQLDSDPARSPQGGSRRRRSRGACAHPAE